MKKALVSGIFLTWLIVHNTPTHFPPGMGGNPPSPPPTPIPVLSR